jgi:hypothetical protein
LPVGGRRRHRCASSKVYLAAMVVLVATLRHGVTTARLERLSQAVGVDRRTVEHWQAWWQDSFTATPFWQVARAAFMPPIDRERLPASLLERFTGDAADRLVALLRFIGPSPEAAHTIAAFRHPHRMLVAGVSRLLLRSGLSIEGAPA